MVAAAVGFSTGRAADAAPWKEYPLGQSGEVIGFHHRLAADTPGLLSRADLLRGDARARGMAYARRLAYLWVGRRMHAATR